MQSKYITIFTSVLSTLGTHFYAQIQSKPNIIILSADDLGIGDLGCYGQKHIQTTNIDRMARQGKRFTNFYTGSPVSSPLRCNLSAHLRNFITNNYK